MSIRKAIPGLVLSSSEVAALVADRVRPQRLAEDDVFPAITYRLIINQHEHSIDRSSGIGEATLRLTAWSDRFEQADQLADLLRDAFDDWDDGYAGPDNDFIECLTLTSDFDEVVAPNADGSDESAYAISSDFEMRYQESHPAGL